MLNKIEIMVITTGKLRNDDLEFCKLQEKNLEKSIGLYNYLSLRLFFHNPIGLELFLSSNIFNTDSGVTITSIYSDVSSEHIKEHILAIYN